MTSLAAGHSELAPEGMKYIAGGTFTMGSDQFYSEESPPRRVKVDTFWMDETPVTNRQFAAFVKATGYRTFAEIPPDPADYPGMDLSLVQPGSLVFRKTTTPVTPTTDWTRWWEFCPGADWRHPDGVESTLEGLEAHPVIHITYEDARAYAKWSGKVLPTEAEWEYAAYGGHDDGRSYAWGSELAPNDQMLANYWQGVFPYTNTMEDGWERTSPVHAFPPNDYGLFDMIGNVWEWTNDWYTTQKATLKKKPGACCVISNPRGGSLRESFDPRAPNLKIPRRVIKGGSHLCAENYCQRYRPAARQGQAIDSSTSHIGFRCIVRDRSSAS